MPGSIFDVNPLYESLIHQSRQSAEQFFHKAGRYPCLVVVGVWDGPARSYLKQICNVAKKCHVKVISVDLSTTIVTDHILSNIISDLDKDNRYDAILVQTPIPVSGGIEIVNRHLGWVKDVDGITAANLGRTLHGLGGFIPCTAEAIFSILVNSKTELLGKFVTIVNDSTVIGKPLSSLLLNAGATVCVCNKFSNENLARMLANSDVVVSATGIPGLIQPSHLKKGVVIIDAGICNVNGTIRGDVSKDVDEVAKLRTKVPGGVGKITTSVLIKNVCHAAMSFHNFETDFLGSITIKDSVSPNDFL